MFHSFYSRLTVLICETLLRVKSNIIKLDFGIGNLTQLGTTGKVSNVVLQKSLHPTTYCSYYTNSTLSTVAPNVGKQLNIGIFFFRQQKLYNNKKHIVNQRWAGVPECLCVPCARVPGLFIRVPAFLYDFLPCSSASFTLLFPQLGARNNAPKPKNCCLSLIFLILSRCCCSKEILSLMRDK